jgi:hypothetical protein
LRPPPLPRCPTRIGALWTAATAARPPGKPPLLGAVSLGHRDRRTDNCNWRGPPCGGAARFSALANAIGARSWWCTCAVQIIALPVPVPVWLCLLVRSRLLD